MQSLYLNTYNIQQIKEIKSLNFTWGIWNSYRSFIWNCFRFVTSCKTIFQTQKIIGITSTTSIQKYFTRCCFFVIVISGNTVFAISNVRFQLTWIWTKNPNVLNFLPLNKLLELLVIGTRFISFMPKLFWFHR